MKAQSQCISFVLKPIVLSIQIALATGVSVVTMSAFANEVSVRDYKVSAGDLATALNQFALQSGIAISTDNQKLNGLKSTGLAGRYSIEQGFQHLLQNTSLQVKKINSGYVLVEKNHESSVKAQAETAHDDQSAVLSTIVLKADSSLANQAKNNYTVSRSSSATKLDLALKDTPQSISIITQKQIEEQNLENVNDVLEATPGITVSNLGIPGAGRARFYSRGYEINNVMIDGNPTLISGTRGMELLAGYDTIIYDRVEVTRGSTGLSTGTGDPSASLNFIRKRPEKEPAYNAKISYGTWDKKRAELDVSQPFTEDGSIRGRFIAAYGQGDSYIDRLSEESKIFYGIVEADLGEKTRLAVGGTYFDKDLDDASPQMTASVADDSVSKGIFNGGQKWNAATDWSYSHIRTWNGFLNLDHEFNDHWKLTTNYQYSRTTPDRKWGLVGSKWYNAENNTASYVIGRENTDSKIHNLDLGLLGKFDFLGREAQIATGINGYYSKTFDPTYGNGSDGILDGTRCFYANSLQSGCIDLNHWNNGAIPYPVNSNRIAIRLMGQHPLDDYRNSYFDRKEQQFGYYLSAKIEPIEHLKLILGTRYNHYKIEAIHYTLGIRDDSPQGLQLNKNGYSYTYKPDDKWIPYAGVVYDLTPHTTAYASYTGIYKNQLVKDIYNGFLPPQEGNSYEMGLNSSLFEDTLNLHAAVFKMKQENIPYKYMNGVPINPETGTAYKCTPLEGGLECTPLYAAKGPTITGFELTAAGQLTPEWMINAGYTFLHVDQPVSGIERKIFTTSMTSGDYSYERPKHAITLATSYKPIEKITIGGAIRWKSKTTQNANILMPGHDYVNDALSQKDFAVVDVMGRYKINQYLTAGLNIQNLFDKKYKTNDVGSLYGAPRNIIFSLSTKF